MLPGFSLVTGSARQRLARLPPRFSAHRPAVDHVNYRWQTESAPDAAGWTYLKFREPVLPFCDFWYTEYEPDPQNPSRGHPSIEPCLNTCQELIGCVWDLRGPERDLVQRVRELTDGELGDDALVLNEQFTIWLDEQSLSPLQALAQQGPFRAMVLGCASLATFKRLASPELVVQWRGQETAILTPYATGWAIVVVERPSPPGARGLTRVGAPL